MTFVSRVREHFLGGSHSMSLGYDTKARLARSSYSHGPGLPPRLRLSRRTHGTVLKSLLSLAGFPPQPVGCLRAGAVCSNLGAPAGQPRWEPHALLVVTVAVGGRGRLIRWGRGAPWRSVGGEALLPKTNASPLLSAARRADTSQQLQVSTAKVRFLLV